MKYKIIRKIISKELSSFLFNYLDLRADTVKYLYDQKLVEPNKWFGFFGDGQIAGNHYAQYGDFAMETLLTMVQPILKKAAGKKLIPTKYNKFGYHSIGLKKLWSNIILFLDNNVKNNWFLKKNRFLISIFIKDPYLKIFFEY